jgi:hypothetical protein
MTRDRLSGRISCESIDCSMSWFWAARLWPLGAVTVPVGTLARRERATGPRAMPVRPAPARVEPVTAARPGRPARPRVVLKTAARPAGPRAEGSGPRPRPAADPAAGGPPVAARRTAVRVQFLGRMARLIRGLVPKGGRRAAVAPGGTWERSNVRRTTHPLRAAAPVAGLRTMLA